MNKALIVREYNAETDFANVRKLEKSCLSGSKNVFCDMMAEPLCRIKFYPVHVMLIAEIAEHGELVGIVQGCIKDARFGVSRSRLKMGYILGLRLCPRHRHMGIGLSLMKEIEAWLTKNGAEYLYVATEENSVASRNLFTLKCNYELLLSNLQIYALPVDKSLKKLNMNVSLEKLQVNQAISFYKDQLNCKDFYPEDIETILRGKPSLGTWICYLNEEAQEGLIDKGRNIETIFTTKASSWIIFSLWNSQEASKLQIRRSYLFQNFLDEVLNYARTVVSPCIKWPSVWASSTEPFGFVFMYGVSGEGKRLRELMKAAWNFAATLAKDLNCKLVMTEVGDSDPLKKHIPQGSPMLCIKDFWYFKKTIAKIGGDNEEKTLAFSSDSGVFVDPRDF